MHSIQSFHVWLLQVVTTHHQHVHNSDQSNLKKNFSSKVISVTIYFYNKGKGMTQIITYIKAFEKMYLKFELMIYQLWNVITRRSKYCTLLHLPSNSPPPTSTGSSLESNLVLTSVSQSQTAKQWTQHQ